MGTGQTKFLSLSPWRWGLGLMALVLLTGTMAMASSATIELIHQLLPEETSLNERNCLVQFDSDLHKNPGVSRLECQSISGGGEVCREVHSSQATLHYQLSFSMWKNGAYVTQVFSGGTLAQSREEAQRRLDHATKRLEEHFANYQCETVIAHANSQGGDGNLNRVSERIVRGQN